MYWNVAAPFIKEEKDAWLAPFVPGDRHKFHSIPRPGTELNWHNRKSAVTGRKEWSEYWQQSKQAVKTTEGGVITVMAPLATTVGIHQRLSRRRLPVVAWLFNMGVCYSGIKGWIAQTSLHDINRFVVHNRCEREMYSQWLGLPLERFEFVPMQLGYVPEPYPEETENPFIVAIGSGYRDFKTLFEVVEKLNLRTILITGPRALEGLTVPPQVEPIFKMPKQDIWRLTQQARVNVIPMTEAGPVAGIVTIVETMRLGRAVVATRRRGVEDYIEDGETGLLVKSHSVNELTEAIDRLWNDSELRNRLNKQAETFALENCTDEAAGASLSRILDSVADEVGLY